MSVYIVYLDGDGNATEGDSVASNGGWVGWCEWAAGGDAHPEATSLAEDGWSEAPASLASELADLVGGRAVSDRGYVSRDVLSVTDTLLSALRDAPPDTAAVMISDGIEGGGDDESEDAGDTSPDGESPPDAPATGAQKLAEQLRESIDHNRKLKKSFLYHTRHILRLVADAPSDAARDLERATGVALSEATLPDNVLKLRDALDGMLREAFDSSKHPRGQPGNAGEFAAQGDGESGAADDAEPAGPKPGDRVKQMVQGVGGRGIVIEGVVERARGGKLYVRTEGTKGQGGGNVAMSGGDVQGGRFPFSEHWLHADEFDRRLAEHRKQAEDTRAVEERKAAGEADATRRSVADAIAAGEVPLAGASVAPGDVITSHLRGVREDLRVVEVHPKFLAVVPADAPEGAAPTTTGKPEFYTVHPRATPVADHTAPVGPPAAEPAPAAPDVDTVAPLPGGDAQLSDLDTPTLEARHAELQRRVEAAKRRLIDATNAGRRREAADIMDEVNQLFGERGSVENVLFGHVRGIREPRQGGRTDRSPRPAPAPENPSAPGGE